MAEKKNVIVLKSFELDYLQQVKDFIHHVAPHINAGLYSNPLKEWRTAFLTYEYATVEWYDDYNFLYYGHGVKTSDRVLEISRSMNIGEL